MEKEKIEKREKEVIRKAKWIIGGLGIIIIILLIILAVMMRQDAQVEPRIISPDVTRTENVQLYEVKTLSVEKMTKDGRDGILIHFEWINPPKDGVEYVFAGEAWNNSVNFQEKKLSRVEVKNGEEGLSGSIFVPIGGDVTHGRVVATGKGQRWEACGGFR